MSIENSNVEVESISSSDESLQSLINDSVEKNEDYDDGKLDNDEPRNSKGNDPVKPQEVTKGYRTYDQWVSEGRDPDEYKGRKVYDKQGEVYSALMDAQHELKIQRDALAAVMRQQHDVEELAYKRAREQLKTEAMEAATLGDSAKVGAITDKLSELERTKVTTPATLPVQQVNPENVFANRNAWYGNPQTSDDFAKIGFAKLEDLKIAQEQNKGTLPKLTMEQHFAELEKRVNQRFSPELSANKEVPKVLSETVSESRGKLMGDKSDGHKLMGQLNSHQKAVVKRLIQAKEKAKQKFTVEDLRRFVSNVRIAEGK